ncbi:MAG: PilZ domain-containing protein, partial [Candidatus Acidiferrales bacterium]
MGAISNLKRQLSSGLVPSPEEITREIPQPRKFLRVPTHAVSVAEDRRRCPRACLCLPLQLTSIGGCIEALPVTLVTKNISSTGIYFLAPRVIDPGTAIELEVALVERPHGCGRVRLRTAAHVVRIDACEVPGWSGFAASFDDIDFQRDDGFR